MAATKTFKIGEYAKGGVITAEVHSSKIVVIGKDWDFSAGTKKTSDQSRAKEFDRIEVEKNDWQFENKLDSFLNDLTTSYYADQIIKWIKSKF